MPKSRHRCVTSLSISWNVPGSNSNSIRSRAVSLPASCWRRRRSSPPPSSARRSRSWRYVIGSMQSAGSEVRMPGLKTRPTVSRADLQVRPLRLPRQLGLRLLPVSDELLQADVGQRMVEERIDDSGGTRADVRSHPRGFDDVHRAARAGDENLRRELVVAEDLDDLLNQVHAGGRHIVQPTDKRAHERRTDFRGEQRLRRREDQGDVDASALFGESLARLHAVARERHLDDDVLVDFCKVASFAHNAIEIGRDDLRADRPLDQVADLLEVLAVVAWFFREQRWVRRDAVDDPERHERVDILEVARVDEDLHVRAPPSREPTGLDS